MPSDDSDPSDASLVQHALDGEVAAFATLFGRYHGAIRRFAYYDREPSGQPSVMGVSIRTARVRYTEWRDWKTGEPVARELYDGIGDPNEMKNAVVSPALAEAQAEAAALLWKQFPPVEH